MVAEVEAKFEVAASVARHHSPRPHPGRDRNAQPNSLEASTKGDLVTAFCKTIDRFVMNK